MKDFETIEREIMELRKQQQKLKLSDAWQFDGDALNRINGLERQITALKVSVTGPDSLRLKDR